MTVASQKKHAGHVRLNSYVPAMQFAADIQEGGVYIVNFGSPPAAATTGIITTMAQDTAIDVGRASFDSATAYLAEATFGATIRAIGTTTNTAAVAVYGRDFYGQPIKETFSLNSDTAVARIIVYPLLTTV